MYTCHDESHVYKNVCYEFISPYQIRMVWGISSVIFILVLVNSIQGQVGPQGTVLRDIEVPIISPRRGRNRDQAARGDDTLRIVRAFFQSPGRPTSQLGLSCRILPLPDNLNLGRPGNGMGCSCTIRGVVRNEVMSKSCANSFPAYHGLSRNPIRGSIGVNTPVCAVTIEEAPGSSDMFSCQSRPPFAFCLMDSENTLTDNRVCSHFNSRGLLGSRTRRSRFILFDSNRYRGAVIYADSNFRGPSFPIRRQGLIPDSWGRPIGSIRLVPIDGSSTALPSHPWTNVGDSLGMIRLPHGNLPPLNFPGPAGPAINTNNPILNGPSLPPTGAINTNAPMNGPGLPPAGAINTNPILNGPGLPPAGPVGPGAGNALPGPGAFNGLPGPNPPVLPPAMTPMDAAGVGFNPQPADRFGPLGGPMFLQQQNSTTRNSVRPTPARQSQTSPVNNNRVNRAAQGGR